MFNISLYEEQNPVFTGFSNLNNASCCSLRISIFCLFFFPVHIPLLADKINYTP